MSDDKILDALQYIRTYLEERDDWIGTDALISDIDEFIYATSVLASPEQAGAWVTECPHIYLNPPQAGATVPDGYAIGRDGSAVYIMWNDSKRREHFTRYSNPITFGFLLAMLAASQPDAVKESAS